MSMTEEQIASVGGLKIFVRSWLPEGQPRALVMIVPGFNSHGGQYIDVATQFAAKGLAVYAVDLRGRGRSDGERFYVDSFADYVADVHVAMKVAKGRLPGLKTFLLGHSAGGVVSCGYALDYQSDVSGLVCESFAFQVPAPDFALAVLKGLSHVAPHAHVLRLKNEDFSRDPAQVAALNADPLIAHETQPTRTVAEMVRADERLKRDFPQIKVPVLILHGTLDRATKPSGSQLFYEKTGSTDKTLKLYDGYFHDPLHDVGKEVVMADIQAWIDQRI
jgi:acylglycerol lipase